MSTMTARTNAEKEFQEIRKKPLFIAVMVSLFNDIVEKIRSRLPVEILSKPDINDDLSWDRPFLVLINGKQVNTSKDVINAAFAIFEPDLVGGIFHSGMVRDLAVARICSEILSHCGVDGTSFEEYLDKTSKQRYTKSHLFIECLGTLSRLLGGESKIKEGEYFIQLSGKLINVTVHLEALYRRLMHEKDNRLSYITVVKDEVGKISS